MGTSSHSGLMKRGLVSPTEIPVNITLSSNVTHLIVADFHTDNKNLAGSGVSLRGYFKFEWSSGEIETESVNLFISATEKPFPTPSEVGPIPQAVDTPPSK